MVQVQVARENNMVKMIGHLPPPQKGAKTDLVGRGNSPQGRERRCRENMKRYEPAAPAALLEISRADGA